MLNVNKQEDLGNSMGENNVGMKVEGELQEAASAEIVIPQITQPTQEEIVPIQKIKKVSRLYLGIATYRLIIDYWTMRIHTYIHIYIF